MTHSHLLVWLFLSLVLAQMEDHPYCSIRYERLCQGKGTHVGCQFPYRGHGEACENYTAIIFSDDLKHFILSYINRRRNRIASGHERVRGGAHLPRPEVMMLVQWDRELAYLAQRLANQCRFLHDDCRATVRYPYAGQTVGEVRWRRAGESMEMGARRTIGRVFDAWWGERRRVQARQLTTPFMLTARGAVWGHFSQLAVWTLRAMGCGAVHHGSTRPRLLLVCDFSHTNMLGQRTISPGPLAPCPAHTMRIQTSMYPLLCSPVRESETPEQRESYRQYRDEENFDEDDEDLSEEPEDMETVRPRPNRPFRPEPEDAETPRPRLNRPFRPEPEDAETPRPRLNRPFRPEPVDAETPRSRANRPMIPELEDDMEMGDIQQRRIVDMTTQGKTREFDSKTEVAVRYRGNTRDGILREKLNSELNTRNRHFEMRGKAAHKAEMVRDREMKMKGQYKAINGARGVWETSRRSQPTALWSEYEDQEEMGREVIPLRKKPESERQDTTVGIYRPTALLSTEQFQRERWKRPRSRPRRPGANALLVHTPPSKISRRHKASLVLDKEDEDQLFRDTGFKLSKRGQT